MIFEYYLKDVENIISIFNVTGSFHSGQNSAGLTESFKIIYVQKNAQAGSE